jgi:hypothetical protein
MLSPLYVRILGNRPNMAFTLLSDEGVVGSFRLKIKGVSFENSVIKEGLSPIPAGDEKR